MENNQTLDIIKFLSETNQGATKVVAKLAKIKSAIHAQGGVHKGSTGQVGKTAKYSYANGDAVYKLLSPLFEKNDIYPHYSLVPGTRKVRPYTNDMGKIKFDWLQTLHYQFIDTKSGEMIQGFWEVAGTQGQDIAKTLGTALTYSIRYFLLKYFDIATDKDDADAIEVKEETKVKPKVSAQAASLPKPKEKVAPKPAAKKAVAKKVERTEASIKGEAALKTWVKTQSVSVSFKKQLKAKLEEVVGDGSKLSSIESVKQAQEIIKLMEVE